MCDVAPSCAAASPVTAQMYAYISTQKFPDDVGAPWNIQESTACAIASLANVTAPYVGDALDDTSPIDTDTRKAAEDALKNYGEERKWYKLDFCTTGVSATAMVTAATKFFGAKNNSESMNYACNSGTPGIAGVVLVKAKQLTVFSGSTSGTCAPFNANALGYSYPPGPPGPAPDDTPAFLAELYFIIPVSVGGGLIVLVAIGTCIYCVLQDDTDKNAQRFPRLRKGVQKIKNMRQRKQLQAVSYTEEDQRRVTTHSGLRGRIASVL